ncbi:MAG: circadian clock protein KaiC [Nanoarchaeota archaeon]|nr:circadian clock protein KaiC [Nanoarchaeota archaeon]
MVKKDKKKQDMIETDTKQQFSSSQDMLNSPTGITELDDLLGGGFPKGAVILLSGSSGSCKTIFSFQWLFEGIKNNENGIYITLTEPLFKTVKNLEPMDFYDRNAIEQEKLKIIDMREIYEKRGFNQKKILDFIEKQVKQVNAKRLCIDSITAIAYNLDEKSKIRKFIFELGKILATLGCTTILTGEVTEEKRFSVYDVEEFISDAILRLDQIKVRDELQRRMQIIKIRGRKYKTDDIFFKISDQGINVFPKIIVPLNYSSSFERIPTGNNVLDTMMLGGVFKGSSTLIAGSTGTGKTLLATQYIIEGLKRGEPCLYAGFEESREQLLRNAKNIGWDLKEYEEKGLLTLRCIYPREKFLEEHIREIKQIVEDKKIKRCVVDSLSSISKAFPKDSFIDFTKRLNGYLKFMNVTTVFTAATETLIGTSKLTDSQLSTVIDNVIMLRYVEVQGELNQVLNIIKIRGSAHSKDLRRYGITNRGLVIGQSLAGYEGIMTGVTRKVSETIDERLESEFKKFIGPMAPSILSDMKARGLTKENIFSYIDELNSQGIMSEDNSKLFKQDVMSILGGVSNGMVPDTSEKAKGIVEFFKEKKPKTEKSSNWLLGGE